MITVKADRRACSVATENGRVLQKIADELITFSEYAEVSQPGAWKGLRNPVRYTSFEDLGIDPDRPGRWRAGSINHRPWESSRQMMSRISRAVVMLLACANRPKSLKVDGAKPRADEHKVWLGKFHQGLWFGPSIYSVCNLTPGRDPRAPVGGVCHALMVISIASGGCPCRTRRRV